MQCSSLILGMFILTLSELYIFYNMSNQIGTVKSWPFRAFILTSGSVGIVLSLKLPFVIGRILSCSVFACFDDFLKRESKHVCCER